MANLRGVLAFASFGLLAGGCIIHDEKQADPYQECDSDDDCAYLDDGDTCYSAPRCAQQTCQREFRQNSSDCQCEHTGDCNIFGFQEQGCNILNCLQHTCGETIMKEGPSLEQMEGDCILMQCDGSSARGIEEADLTDIDDDNNACTVDSCTADGPANEPLADGDVCLDNTGICYLGDCYGGCVPTNPAGCGSEGPNEPSNNLGGSATAFTDSTAVCGMLDSEDVDWYEMDLVDEEFVADVIGFDIHSSAATIEICAYVLCHNHALYPPGVPTGGCANMLPGPHGSLGCCWEGAPENLNPGWDLDCTETDNDSGTLYFSVRAPSGGVCETYAMGAHY